MREEGFVEGKERRKRDLSAKLERIGFVASHLTLLLLLPL